jgi:hypothetical protein
MENKPFLQRKQGKKSANNEKGEIILNITAALMFKIESNMLSL